MLDPVPAPHHFAQVIAWSGAARIDRQLLLVSLLASALPVAAGLLLQRPGVGEIMLLGALLLAPEASADGAAGRASMPTSMPTSRLAAILASLLPAAAAMIAASLLARLPGADAFMVALVVGAATLVNYSRPAAVAGVRFIVLLVMMLGLIGAHGGHAGAALWFGIGALWRSVLALVVRDRPAAAADAANAANAPATLAARTPTARQRRAHLRRQLASLQGWQYPLRLGAGLGIAAALAQVVTATWPRHHVSWLVLSVVLMTPRALEHAPVAISQRILGTLAGVCLAGALGHAGLRYGAMLVALCLCATLAPLARRGNYAAYCALATPVILLAMEAPGPIDDAVLADRLVATLVGALLVAGANLAMDGLLRLAARRAGQVRPAGPDPGC